MVPKNVEIPYIHHRFSIWGVKNIRIKRDWLENPLHPLRFWSCFDGEKASKSMAAWGIDLSCCSCPQGKWWRLEFCSGPGSIKWWFLWSKTRQTPTLTGWKWLLVSPSMIERWFMTILVGFHFSFFWGGGLPLSSKKSESLFAPAWTRTKFAWRAHIGFASDG
jgi:hypothetical protein